VRTIKTLGIATAMALALIAVAGASMASANNFKSQFVPETWNGSVTGKSHVLSLNGESFTCSNVTFSGETIIKTNKDVTVSPQFKGCTHNLYLANWLTNGCKFRLNPGPGPALVGSIDIVGCETPMSIESELCRNEIGNQSGLGTVTYKNIATSPPTITAVASLSGITYTRSGAGCSGSKGTFSNGTYTGEWTIKGLTSGVPAGVEVESTTPPPPTKFAAEEAPVTIAGSYNVSVGYGPTYFKGFGGNNTSCKSYTLSGTSASITAETVTLKPTYKECTVGLEAVPDSFISVGGCSYVFHENGQFDIAGATCASNPITITRAGCIATIGPQSGLSGFTFANEGSGKLRAVAMSGATGAAVTFTSTGPSCSVQGTFSTGKINSAARLTAFNSKGASQGFWVE
jgi:hypothetical protein